MPSEARYNELFQAATQLTDGLVRIDGQAIPRLGFGQKRKLKNARKLLRQATQESPHNAAPYLMLAKVAESLGEHECCLTHLQQAWELEPQNLILIVELSGAYGHIGQHQQALAILVEGNRHYPNEPRILFNLGLSCLLTHQIQTALEIFAQLVEIEPDYSLNDQLLAYTQCILAGSVPLPQSQSDIAQAMG